MYTKCLEAGECSPSFKDTMHHLCICTPTSPKKPNNQHPCNYLKTLPNAQRVQWVKATHYCGRIISILLSIHELQHYKNQKSKTKCGKYHEKEVVLQYQL